jgi:hypothetical protein
MRTRRLIVVSLVVLALFALNVAPAAAQSTYIAVRYWATQTNVSLSGGPSFRAYDSGMISLSVRRMFEQPWSLSFNIDAGSQTNWGGTWAGATTGANTHWNINLHRDFRMENTNFSVFLGYGSANSRSTFGTEQKQQVDGLRVGGDLMWSRDRWSVAAWGAVGVGMQGQSSQPGFITARGGGTYSDFGGLVGYHFSERWGLEGGYRWLNYGVPAGLDFQAARFTTSGFTIGLSGRF